MNQFFDKCHRFNIIAKITDSVLIKGSYGFGSFTEYSIDISTNLTSWQITKRYSDFEKLNIQLANRINPLPKLPPKSFFCLNDRVISERKIALEDYLNQLLSKHNLYAFPAIMEFIGMEKELFMLLVKCPSQIEQCCSYKDVKLISKNKSFENLIQMKKANSNENKVDDSFYYEFNKDESEKLELIDNFLRGLELSNENKCSVVHEFWVYLTKKWPIFLKEEIMKLYYGDGNNLKGLLFHCGKVSENSLGAQSCLELLNKLIRCEYNPDCEKFLAVLKMGRLESLRKMRLEYHLKSRKNSVVLNCYNIIKEVVNRERGIDLSNFLNDEIAENKFLNWMGFKDSL